MIKTALVSFAVLTLATSAALAATHKTTHHHHAVKPSAAATASPSSVGNASPFWRTSAADHELYLKNQRDSGLAGKKQ